MRKAAATASISADSLLDIYEDIGILNLRTLSFIQTTNGACRLRTSYTPFHRLTR